MPVTFKRRIPRDIILNRILASSLITERMRFHALRALGMSFADPVFVKPGCFFVSTDLEIGANSGLEYEVRILNEAKVTIGSYTGLGAQTMIVTGSHALGDENNRAGAPAPMPVRIGNGCWIGARVTILPGVVIGDGCVIGAGSVVASSCDAHAIYMGNPAEKLRQLRGPGGGRRRRPAASPESADAADAPAAGGSDARQ